MTCLIRSNIPKSSQDQLFEFSFQLMPEMNTLHKQERGANGWILEYAIGVLCSSPAIGWLSLLETPFSDCESEPVSKDLLCKFQFTPYYCRHIADAIMDNAFESSKNVSFSFSICISSVISLLSRDSISILLCSMWFFTGFYSLYFFFWHLGSFSSQNIFNFIIYKFWTLTSCLSITEFNIPWLGLATISLALLSFLFFFFSSWGTLEKRCRWKHMLWNLPTENYCSCAGFSWCDRTIEVLTLCRHQRSNGICKG